MKVIINGSDGAMGTILARVIAQTDDMEVIAGVTPTGADGAYLTMDDYQGPADMVIDFSHHTVTTDLMDYCVKRGLPAVVCTTGQTEEEMAYITKAADSIPVFKSANMSVGVALVAKVVKEAKREPDEIGISAIRMGNIVGTHEVMFGTNTQTITVAHQAHDRALFADGAVAAARFLAGKPAGLYNMDDLLAD